MRSVIFIVIEEVKRKPDKSWPVGRSAFKGVIEYKVVPEEGCDPEKLFIDYDFADKYGRTRRMVTVYRKKSRPLAKFIGTDRWGTNRNLIWKLRHNEGNGLVRDLRNKPEGYEGFTPVRFRRVVNGPGASACWGIETKESARDLIRIGLTRESLHE